jgi:hypothetical protein
MSKERCWEAAMGGGGIPQHRGVGSGSHSEARELFCNVPSRTSSAHVQQENRIVQSQLSFAFVSLNHCEHSSLRTRAFRLIRSHHQVTSFLPPFHVPNHLSKEQQTPKHHAQNTHIPHTRSRSRSQLPSPASSPRNSPSRRLSRNEGQC